MAGEQGWPGIVKHGSGRRYRRSPAPRSDSQATIGQWETGPAPYGGVPDYPGRLWMAPEIRGKAQGLVGGRTMPEPLKAMMAPWEGPMESW